MRFYYRDKWYEYFVTENPDRRVEVPIILDYYEKYKDKKLLEIGNVLVNHIPITHDVVDKYEKLFHDLLK